MIRTVPVLALIAAPAFAEVPLSAEAFEAYVTGKTLIYSDRYGPFGIEEYLPDRKVRWSYLDGECEEGMWYAAGSQVCFVYESIPTPQCWQFFQGDGGLAARFENNPEALEVYQTGETDEPLYCPPPWLGS